MSPPAGPAAKTERLLNLVLCLLYTRRPLPKARLREMVPQYAGAPTTEAFERMFERDKDELRELGIPLVTEELNSIWEDEPGYRIHQRDYALPDLDFAPDELAVLGLASRAWAQASLAGPAAEAIRKLKAAGIERDEDSLVGIEPRLRTVEPAFDAMRTAVDQTRTIRFTYRRPDGAQSERTVQTWGLANWRGRWYLTGFDLDRGAERVFRLSRVVGDVISDPKAEPYAVPAGHDPSGSVRRVVAEPTVTGEATIRVRSGQGHALRRRAHTTTRIDDFWDEVQLDLADPVSLAQEIAGFGSDVVAVSPDSVVAEVRSLLIGALAAHGEEGR